MKKILGVIVGCSILLLLIIYSYSNSSLFKREKNYQQLELSNSIENLLVNSLFNSDDEAKHTKIKLANKRFYFRIFVVENIPNDSIYQVSSGQESFGGIDRVETETDIFYNVYISSSPPIGISQTDLVKHLVSKANFSELSQKELSFSPEREQAYQAWLIEQNSDFLIKELESLNLQK